VSASLPGDINAALFGPVGVRRKFIEEIASHQNEASTIIPGECGKVKFLTFDLRCLFQRNNLCAIYSETFTEDLLPIVYRRKHEARIAASWPGYLYRLLKKF
jgi:hypothetical protein